MARPSPPRYREYRPSHALGRLVERYWTFRGETPPGAAPGRVLPDGCSDVLFDLGDSTRVDGDGRPRCYVVGAMTRAIRVGHEGAVDLLGVRFRPGGAGVFTALPPWELVDDHADLNAVWGSTAREAWERLGETERTAARLHVLEQALLSRLRIATSRPDALVLRAASLLADDGLEAPDPASPPEASAGNVFGAGAFPEASRRRFPTVGGVAERLGVSRRHLERRFRAEVGLTPAQLRSSFRLRRAATLVAEESRTLGDVALRAGYHDQPHMNRDFRRLAGLTPGAYRRELAKTTPPEPDSAARPMSGTDGPEGSS